LFHVLIVHPRAPPEEDPAEVEAKRRRKLEVLQMLSGDSSIDFSTVTAKEESRAVAPPAPATLKLVGLPAAKGKTGSGTATAPVAKASSTFGVVEAEEEDRPQRQIVPLEYTTDELQGVNAHYLATLEDDDDEEVAENGAVYKKKKRSAADILRMQTNAISAAQAISASVAGGGKGSSSSSSSSSKKGAAESEASNAGSGTLDQKAVLRQLLDRIPTQKFVY
jgi:hypothetical protein